eukprot:4115686-Prymnesium_polylepis.1
MEPQQQDGMHTDGGGGRRSRRAPFWRPAESGCGGVEGRRQSQPRPLMEAPREPPVSPIKG